MKITDKQKERMNHLGIAWSDDMSIIEARDAIVDALELSDVDVKKIRASELKTDTLVVLSQFDD